MSEAYIQEELHPSGAETVTGQSADFTVKNNGPLAFYLDVTAASGTSPTLDVTIEERDPISGKYFTVVTFTQAIAAGSERKELLNLPGKTIRAKWEIGGTGGPSFTFSLAMAGKDRG